MNSLIDLAKSTIRSVSKQMEQGEFTSLELTTFYLERISQFEPSINCFVRIETELALDQARASDKRRQSKTLRGILDGIPYTLKDVFATRDSPTTASSKMLQGWTAPYNATVYTRLLEAGAVLLGKVNTDEFTMGVSTRTSVFGVTRNPWDLNRVSGGSSGGPAAAMAARFGLFSIGTDTGGSIRQPAGFCGVVGLRPTYGRVSRMGEIAMASSLDQTGPLTLTAEDAALVLQVLAGHDPLDSTSSQHPTVDYIGEFNQGAAGLRIGVPQEYFGEGVQPGVETLIREALQQLEGDGAVLVPLSLPTIPLALPAYYIICPAEVSSNMARYDGIRFGYSVERQPGSRTLTEVYEDSRGQGLGEEVERRVMLGTHVLSSGYYDAYYNQAQKMRESVTAEFKKALQSVDILAGPVSPHPAFRIDENMNDPLALYKEDVLTVPLNIAGLPGLSVPCGFLNGLPVGLQLIAGAFKEATLLRTAHAFQSTTDAHFLLSPLL